MQKPVQNFDKTGWSFLYYPKQDMLQIKRKRDNVSVQCGFKKKISFPFIYNVIITNTHPLVQITDVISRTNVQLPKGDLKKIESYILYTFFYRIHQEKKKNRVK